MSAGGECHESDVPALLGCSAREEHVDEGKQCVQRGNGQSQFEDASAVLPLEPDEKRKSSEQVVLSPELIDKDEEDGSFGQPRGKRCPYGSPAEPEDEERVEQDIHHKSRTADVERCLAASRSVVDARKGSREKDEGQCCRDNAQVGDGVVGDMCFQFEKAHNGPGENKQQSAPANGDEQCDADVVRGKRTRVVPVLRPDGLCHTDFRPHFVQQSDRA